MHRGLISALIHRKHYLLFGIPPLISAILYFMNVKIVIFGSCESESNRQNKTRSYN